MVNSSNRGFSEKRYLKMQRKTLIKIIFICLILGLIGGMIFTNLYIM